MKELHKLLKYRDYYVYSKMHEFLRIKHGENREEAVDTYSNIVRNFYLQGDERWAFDIALDCIRNFTESEVAFIQEHKEIFDYHFNYGMYVRNTYVHPSRFHPYLTPDKISSIVYNFIIGIVCEEVNPFKKIADKEN